MSLILDGTNGLSDVDGSAATPAIRGTDTNTGIFFPAADTIAFAEGGTEVARIDSSGNLGIGTTSPTTALSVFTGNNGTNLNVRSRAHLGGTHSSDSLVLGYSVKADTAANDRMVGTETNSGGGAPAAILMNSGNIQFHTATSVTAGAAFSSERMRIDSSGIVTGTAGNLMLVRATSVASTSGTSIDFTGIPSWARKITVMFQGVSTNGTSHLLVQIGAGSVTTSGYATSTGTAINSAASGFYASSNAGFLIFNGAAANIFNGTSTILNVSSNTWTNAHVIGGTDASRHGGGSIALGGTLDRVRITTVNGTDVFDAGNINILYE
jgi:hypothetical protein